MRNRLLQSISAAVFLLYEGTRDQPMPEPFPTPPIFLREKHWGRGRGITENSQDQEGNHFIVRNSREVLACFCSNIVPRILRNVGAN